MEPNWKQPPAHLLIGENNDFCITLPRRDPFSSGAPGRLEKDKRRRRVAAARRLSGMAFLCTRSGIIYGWTRVTAPEVFGLRAPGLLYRASDCPWAFFKRSHGPGNDRTSGVPALFNPVDAVTTMAGCEGDHRTSWF
ncbi:hypothetical protein DPEC_G00227150 [Dallia pectoralis]|uniref:Uncharacterized protein n=1 Tax=Dallia pectoralis TaxID=75939 RepID=A0ACC2G155_DALPE|nr:hypothetical protein DPEC_G00227150 [Dallia pectoralis]